VVGSRRVEDEHEGIHQTRPFRFGRRHWRRGDCPYATPLVPLPQCTTLAEGLNGFRPKLYVSLFCILRELAWLNAFRAIESIREPGQQYHLLLSAELTSLCRMFLVIVAITFVALLAFRVYAILPQRAQRGFSPKRPCKLSIFLGSGRQCQGSTQRDLTEHNCQSLQVGTPAKLWP
jgi:hypothetical protein